MSTSASEDAALQSLRGNKEALAEEIAFAVVITTFSALWIFLSHLGGMTPQSVGGVHDAAPTSYKAYPDVLGFLRIAIWCSEMISCYFFLLAFLYIFFFPAGEWDTDASPTPPHTPHPIVIRLSGKVWSSIIRLSKPPYTMIKKSQVYAEKFCPWNICFSSKSRGTRFPALIVDRTIMQIRRRESGTSTATRWHSCVVPTFPLSTFSWVPSKYIRTKVAVLRMDAGAIL